MRFSRQRLNTDLIALEKLVAFLLASEMDAQLRIHDVANDQRTGGRPLERIRRRSIEGFVRYQDVEQDVRVDSGNHRPRTSSMNLSTDEYPSFLKEAAQRPFHLARLSFFGAPFSTIEPSITENSTSVSGPRLNCSRICFGIVTCPRSPIFIF